MKKNSALHIPCTYCEKDSLPETDPPVCEEHAKLDKKASETVSTLKELDSKHD